TVSLHDALPIFECVHSVGGFEEARGRGVLRVTAGDEVLGGGDRLGVDIAVDFLRPPGHSDLIAGGHQDAHLGLGGHDRGDVTAFDDDARRCGRDVVPLLVDELLSGVDDAGDRLHIRRHLRAADLFGDVDVVNGDEELIGAQRDLEIGPAHLFEDVDGIGDSAVEAQPRHRTVHGPGVEVLVAQPARHLLGGARLPHSGWSVNGYDAHAVPSFSMADSGICHPFDSKPISSSCWMAGTTDTSTMPSFRPKAWSMRKSSTLMSRSPMSLNSWARIPGRSGTRIVTTAYVVGGCPCLPGIRSCPSLPKAIAFASSPVEPGPSSSASMTSSSSVRSAVSTDRTSSAFP